MTEAEEAADDRQAREDGFKPSGEGPYADVLRQYDREQRKRRRKRYKVAHEHREVEKQSRRDARYTRRKRREPVVRGLVALVGLLPPAWAALLGDLVGSFAYRFAKAARYRVRFQLRMAFPDVSDAELKRLARQSIGYITRGMATLPAQHRKGAAWVRNRTEVVDEHHLREALDGGHGAIVVTMHHGPMVAGGVWLARDWNGVAVGRDARTLDTLQVVIDLRAGLGLPTIERGDPRAIVRALRDNRPVAILADHDVGGIKGVFVPFFGHLAHTPLGPAALSVRTKAPIVVAVTEWVGFAHYRVRLLGLLQAREDLPKDEAAHELTYRYTKVCEEVIRANPSHWMWLHKRWETRPERRPDLPVWIPTEGPDSDVCT